MKARVYVTLRAGVLDPQGRAVQATLGRLGFDEVAGVRIGKYIELELADIPDSQPEGVSDEGHRQQVLERITAMCDKVLANPVMEDYRVEIVE